DLGGIMQVLLDETSLDGATMRKFIDRHKKIATETFGPETEFVERNETNRDNGQSKEHQFRRVDIIVTRNGRKYKIEMLFVPLKSYLINEYQYGASDPETGRKGPAHPVYEELRRKIVFETLFPTEHFGNNQWGDLTAFNS